MLLAIGCGRIGFVPGERAPGDDGGAADSSVITRDASATDGPWNDVAAGDADGADRDGSFRLDAGLDGSFDATIDAEIEAGSDAAFDAGGVNIVIERPTPSSALLTRFSPITIRGSCGTGVTALTTTAGALADSDCSDGTWALGPLDLTVGTLNFVVQGTAPGVGSIADTLTIIHAVTPPAAPAFTSFSVPSGSDENFPIVRGTPDGTTVRIYGDAACTEMLGARYLGFSGEGVPIAVDDNSVTALYATAADGAGNVTACTSLGTSYAEVTPNPVPVACDVTVSSNLTFLGFQAILDAANAARATHMIDGHIAICLSDGVLISTSSPGEGERLVVADDFYIHAPVGRAELSNLRASGTGEEVGVLDVVGNDVTLAHLDIESVGPLQALTISGRVRALRDVEIRTTANLANPIELPPSAMVLEIVDSTLRSTGSSAHLIDGSGGVFIRRIKDSTLETFGTTASCFARQRGNFTDFTIGLIEDTELRARGDGAFGLVLESSTQFLAIRNSRFVRSAGASPGGTAILVRTTPDQYIQGFKSFFTTDRVRDNVFCHEAGAAPWSLPMLVEVDAPYSAPTTPNVGGDFEGPFGAATFPWGDADDGAANPGQNLQTHWGGACP